MPGAMTPLTISTFFRAIEFAFQVKASHLSLLSHFLPTKETSSRQVHVEDYTHIIVGYAEEIWGYREALRLAPIPSSTV